VIKLLSVPVELADGTIKEYPYGFCYFTFVEETVAGNDVIAPARPGFFDIQTAAEIL
jgi:hypothetical protein